MRTSRQVVSRANWLGTAPPAHKPKRAQRHDATLVSPVGLPPWLADRLDQRLDRLSGGQRHYLALWAVLDTPADLVLLDEPTNNLDRAGVAHLTRHLRDLAASGRGILIVSHDAGFVAAACDRVVTLEPCDVE